MDNKLKLAYILSTVTAIILLYAPIKTGIVLLPGFFVFLVLSVKKIRWAQLVWLGIVGYFVYFSLIGIVGAIATGVYKIFYLVSFFISAFSFYCGLFSQDITTISFKLLKKELKIIIAGYLVLFAILVLGEIYINFIMILRKYDFISTKDIVSSTIFLLTNTCVLIIPYVLVAYHILKEGKYGTITAPVLLVISSIFFIDPDQKSVLENIRYLAFDMNDFRGYTFVSLGYYFLYILFVITVILLFLFFRNMKESDSIT